MPESRLPKLERETLHDRTYETLRSAIMAAKFAPGERLTVRGVAESLGVSPMPVRAALGRLQAEKALVQNAAGTMEIPRMTGDHYRDLIMLRALIEGKAAELAADVITRKELAQLEKIGAELTAASKSGDATAYIDANQRFKFAIVAAARSDALSDFSERLWLQVGPFMRFYATDVHKQHALDRHEEAIEALRRADGEAARKAIERDILDGAEFLFGIHALD